MKSVIVATVLAVSLPMVAIAQSSGKNGMGGMKMEHNAMSAPDRPVAKHQAIGVVKSLDRTKGLAMLMHEPVATLKWPAMTMSFKVKDPAMLDKLALKKKVHFEFVQEGKAYVITDVK